MWNNNIWDLCISFISWAFSPFFLLVVKGWVGLLGVHMNIIFMLASRFVTQIFQLLISQYVDDTIFLGEPTVKNLWTLIVILLCFHMNSSLQVNFAKVVWWVWMSITIFSGWQRTSFIEEVGVSCLLVLDCLWGLVLRVRVHWDL